MMDFLPQDADTQGVKGRNERPGLQLLAQQMNRPLEHFAGGFVGERDRQNAIRGNATAD